jgi:hypothetical protein
MVPFGRWLYTVVPVLCCISRALRARAFPWVQAGVRPSTPSSWRAVDLQPVTCRREPRPASLTLWSKTTAAVAIKPDEGRLRDVETDELWTIIPRLKSVGGGAGIFAEPPSMDKVQSSEVSALSVDPAGSASRKIVSRVLAEISEDFAERADGAKFNQLETTRDARPPRFTYGWCEGHGTTPCFDNRTATRLDSGAPCGDGRRTLFYRSGGGRFRRVGGSARFDFNGNRSEQFDCTRAGIRTEASKLERPRSTTGSHAEFYRGSRIPTASRAALRALQIYVRLARPTARRCSS